MKPRYDWCSDPTLSTKVPIFRFDPADWKTPGNNQVCWTRVFSVSSYILVLRYMSYYWRSQLGWPKWLKCVGPTGTSVFPILLNQLVRKMHWNHQKVSGLYLQKSNQDMAVFSKGLVLKNDIFCSESFLTPLNVLKTSTNIWKQLGIFQNPSQDSKNIKIGLLDQILAPLKST